MATASHSALFVCLGNICRSPIAHAVMKQLVTEQGNADQWHISSAATSTYQIGDSPDPRGQKCMRKNGIYQHVEKHRAIQITKDDYNRYDYIFGMDKNNMRNLEQMAPKGEYKAKLLKLGDFDPDKSYGGIIEDPYYGDDDSDFDVVYEQCLRSCKGFLEQMSE